MTEKNKKAMIWVESGFSNGHLQTISLLSKELEKKNIDVVIVTGSMQAPTAKDISMGNAKVIDLPEQIYKNGTYITNSGKDAATDKEWQKEREKIISDTFEKEKPDTVITEIFPLSIRGGNQRELLSLLEATKNSDKEVKLYSLTRDDLFVENANSENLPREGRTLEFQRKIYNMLRASIGGEITNKLKNLVLKANPGLNKTDLINDYFTGGVIVRGDSEISIGKNAAFVEQIKQPIHHTGFFVTEMEKRDDKKAEDREVIISSGGGWREDDMDLHKSSILARENTELKNNKWRHVVSNSIPDKDFETLKAMAEEKGNGNIVIEKSRPDLRDLIAQSALSISKNGYNTLMEVTKADVPAVIVERNGYLSENLRARAFGKKAGINIASELDIQNSDNFATIINNAINKKKRSNDKSKVNMDGAKGAAELISREINRENVRSPSIEEVTSKIKNENPRTSAPIKNIINEGPKRDHKDSVLLADQETPSKAR